MKANRVQLRVLVLILTAGAVAWAPPLARGDKSSTELEDFFKAGEVLELALEIDKTEMDSLRRDARKYVKATLKEGSQEYKEVGIHLKGAAGSFRSIDDKPGLTLNMDKFVDRQLFHGMDKFHLNNSVQDGSYVSELICGELFRAAGVPASRVRHALLTINGKKKGLYYLKEGYDTGFLMRNFGVKTGNFYDGGFLRDLDQPLQILSSKGDVEKHADLKAVWAAADERDLKKRFEKLEKLLDLDRFISYLCLEVITWDWDGYPMNRNNYRVYHDPQKDKIIFIPSGMDQMFGDPNGTLTPNFQGKIARHLLETPEGKSRYYARMSEIMKTVFDPEAISKRLDELEVRLRPALATVDPGAARDYPNQIRRLREAVKQRQKSVEESLKRVNR